MSRLFPPINGFWVRVLTVAGWISGVLHYGFAFPVLIYGPITGIDYLWGVLMGE